VSVSVLLITPPFTQLNTPYPATAFLKGFLNTKKISSFQADLGLEVTLKVFCRAGLEKAFATAQGCEQRSDNAARIWLLRHNYIQTIDAVIRFMQGKDTTLAYNIAKMGFLPQAGRFAQLPDLNSAFGNMGIQDKAKHFATLYLEDLTDFIAECVDPHFGLTRYAEKLARSVPSFDALFEELQAPPSFSCQILFDILEPKLATLQPELVAVSVPFPGNLYMALRCGQYIQHHFPQIKTAIGGGFANTELRSVSDPRVFQFTDFITLDDGEVPIEHLLKYIRNEIPKKALKRTFLTENGKVIYCNNIAIKEYAQAELGTPDYSDFLQSEYITAIEVVNPMHSLWTDGRWNKLLFAHGCYWGKCTFCDITLDYIERYEPIAAALLADRVETIIAQTGQTGFHFADEAAPPALMRAFALEIIRRNITLSWWANIRFEKSFTRDLCVLLRQSGCIAVSGGLEVASDRLLALINKGITVAQTARVAGNFTESGIMVHAYLMYGFPTQTAQETIDSLEMVRQLFKKGILNSAYWHLFSMTVHSPIGQNPEKFNVVRINKNVNDFANNDLAHLDPTGTEHELFSDGLKKALFNYMHNTCFDYPLQKWFDFKVPKTKVAPDYIAAIVQQAEYRPLNLDAKVIWTGILPSSEIVTKSKKGAQWEVCSITFINKQTQLTITITPEQGKWLLSFLPQADIRRGQLLTIKEVKASYEAAGLTDFEMFWDNKPVNQLYKFGLLVL
jgi:hypothetical protein